MPTAPRAGSEERGPNAAARLRPEPVLDPEPGHCRAAIPQPRM